MAVATHAETPAPIARAVLDIRCEWCRDRGAHRVVPAGHPFDEYWICSECEAILHANGLA